MSNVKKHPAAPAADAIETFDKAERCVEDAKSLTSVIGDLLIGQTDNGQVSLNADGLFLLIRHLNEKCEEASGLLAQLRPAVATHPN